MLLFVITTAGAQPNAKAVVTISDDQSLYGAQQDVIIYVTFSNPTKHSFRILKWYTPLDGVEQSLFKVSLDGAPVSYTEPIYKRPSATGQLRPAVFVCVTYSLAVLVDTAQLLAIARCDSPT